MRSLAHISVFLIFSLFIVACSSEPPLDKKTKVLNALQTMEKHIEAKALDDFMDYVSDDFKSTRRGWGKKDAERLLRIRMMRNQNIHVHQAIKRIDWLNEGDAQAEIEVVVAVAGSEFNLNELPSIRADMVKFIVTFKLIEDQYLITNSEWSHARPTDFVF